MTTSLQVIAGQQATHSGYPTMADWQKDLSFSDRLGLIVSITAAYKDAHPELSSAEASQNARKLESDALSKSVTFVDYRVRCEAIVEDLEISTQPNQTQAPTTESIASQIIQDAKITAKFGSWKNVAHHQNGIFSEVYVAKAPESDKYVALKVTNLGAMQPPHNSEREVRIMKKHAGPNMISLIESFYDGAGHLVLVLPFLPFSLEQLLVNKKPFNDDTKSFLKDMFKGLAHLHSQGVIHRDIKPGNVLLQSTSGPAYLSDFGISWSPIDPGSEPTDKKITDVGTTCYRPPELLFGYTSYDTSLDLWAAGCVVAEAIRANGLPLFNSGDLGTDLTLVLSIFETIGTPTEQTWPELANIPDWGKVTYHKHLAKLWTEILPNLSANAIDLVSNLVRYSQSQRVTASQVLEHSFFAE